MSDGLGCEDCKKRDSVIALLREKIDNGAAYLKDTKADISQIKDDYDDAQTIKTELYECVKKLRDYLEQIKKFSHPNSASHGFADEGLKSIRKTLED